MEIDEDIIKKVLFQHTDIPEGVINRFVDIMKKEQEKTDTAFEDFIDRTL